MKNNNNIKRIPSSEFEYKEPVIYIEYIISNCHIEIKYSVPENKPDEFYNGIKLVFEYIELKFKNSFKTEKQIWEDYKYIHNKEIKLKDYWQKSKEIIKLCESHFNSIYEDAKKVYERRNK